MKRLPFLFAAALLGTVLQAPATAQLTAVEYCFSPFRPAAAATGVAFGGGMSEISINVPPHATVTINPPAGAGRAAVAAMMTAALTGAGFTVVAGGPNCICITAGPGGVAVARGAQMRSTDTGIRGPWGKIVQKPLLPAPPVPPPVPAAVKKNGVVLPVPNPAPATVGGFIQIDVVVVGAGGALINISVQVQVNQGDSQQQIDQKIQQALSNLGLRVRDVTVPTPLGPNNFQTCYGIDRTFNGEEVIGIGFEQDQLFLPDVIGVGLFVESGATEFGDPFSPPGHMLPPMLLDVLDPVAIGSTFNFQVEHGLPGFPGGLAISGVLNPIELGVFGVPDLWLFPGLPLTLAPLSFDASGFGQVPLPVPPDPSLVGVELFSQAFVFSASGVPVLSNGLQTKIGS